MLKLRWLLIISLVLNGLLLAAGSAFVYKKGGIGRLLNEKPAPLETAYFRERRGIFQAMPCQEGAIIFLGDSLTERCAWSELMRRPDILNRGIGGESLESINLRLDEVLRHHPRQLFVMAGINDLLEGRSSEQVVSQQRKLLAKVRKSSPRTKVFLQSLLPINRINFATRPPDVVEQMQKNTNAGILEVNRALAKMADRKQVFYLNIHDLVMDKNRQLDLKYTLDGLHINGKGYAQWAQILRPVLDV